MAILENTGNTFSSGESVTAARLNTITSGATFATGDGEAVDGTTLQVHGGGYLQVKDLGITTGKLANQAVTATQIANNTITSAQMASGIAGSLFTDGSIAGAKLEDDAVSLAKMEDGTRGDILTYDSGGEPVRVSIGSANTFLRVNSAGTDVEWASSAPASKYSTGWATSHGGVNVLNTATLTITHNLGTTDVQVQVWVSAASAGTNPQLVSGLSSGGGNGRGATVTNLSTTTCVVQLGADGYLDINGSGVVTETSFLGSYLKVVVIG